MRFLFCLTGFMFMNMFCICNSMYASNLLLNKSAVSADNRDSFVYNYIGSLTLFTNNIELSERALITIIQSNNGTVAEKPSSNSGHLLAKFYKIKMPTNYDKRWVDHIESTADSVVANALLPVTTMDIDIHLRSSYTQIKSVINRNELQIENASSEIEKEILQKANLELEKHLSAFETQTADYTRRDTGVEFDIIMLYEKSSIGDTFKSIGFDNGSSDLKSSYIYYLQRMAPICLVLVIIGVIGYTFKKWKGMG